MLTEEKFTEAVNTYMDMVYRIALNYMRDHSAAEDVCQEVFLRYLRRGPEPGDAEYCRHWLVRVAVNESKRALALPWRKLESAVDEMEQPKAYRPERDDTFDIIMQMPEKYRIVLYLYYYEGFSAKEMAQILRCPEATIRSQLDRGRKKLKQRILEAENV